MRNKLIGEKVTHSSARLFPLSDPDFPYAPPRLGVIVRAGYSRDLERQIADIYYESPQLISPGRGEIVELDECDGAVRVRLISIAEDCRALSRELEKEACRLEEAATQEELFDGMPGVNDKPSAKEMKAATTNVEVKKANKREEEMLEESNTLGGTSNANIDVSFLNSLDDEG